MFKYILIFLLLIVFVPVFRNFLFNLLVGKQIAKEQKRYNDNIEKQRGKEGDVKVKKTEPASKKGGFEGGQYVDYEEIK